MQLTDTPSQSQGQMEACLKRPMESMTVQCGLGYEAASDPDGKPSWLKTGPETIWTLEKAIVTETAKQSGWEFFPFHLVTTEAPGNNSWSIS